MIFEYQHCLLQNYCVILHTIKLGSQLKEFKEVREVKAICFTAKYSTKKAVGYNF